VLEGEQKENVRYHYVSILHICNRMENSFLFNLFSVLVAGFSHMNDYYPSLSRNIKRLLFQGKRKERYHWQAIYTPML